MKLDSWSISDFTGSQASVRINANLAGGAHSSQQVASEHSTKTVATENKTVETAQAIAAEAQEIRQAVDTIEEAVQAGSRRLQFNVDEEVGRVVVSVLDEDSGEVIRQIPTEDVIRLATRMKDLINTPEGAVGLLVDDRI